MKKFADIKEHLLEVQLQDLSRYVGYPVLTVTPVTAYAYGSDGCKKAFLCDKVEEEWVIFDGNILLTKETDRRTYWVFECLSN